MKEHDLPPGWVTAPLSDLADIQLGKMLDRKRVDGTLLPYLRNINVRWDRIDTSDLLEMPFKEQELERYGLQPGDVLVCEGGEPGRAAVWKREEPSIKYQKALHRVRLSSGVTPRWFVLQLLHDAQSGALSRRFTGTTIKHLPRERLREYPIRVASHDEQHRIVEATDSYFTRLDDAEQTLERVRRNLERYRASVLAAAVEGRLVPTEAELAHAEGRDYEPASVLLDRILAERRRRWEEAELAKMTAKGKAPKDDRWKSKYPEPAEPDGTRLSPLPEGWNWAPLDALAEVKGGITKGQKRATNRSYRSVPYLRVANVQRGFLDLSKVKRIEATEAEIAELRLYPGDVLFNEGGDRDKLGRGWVWGGELPECIHQNHVFRARPYSDDIDSKFVSWYSNTNGQAYFLEEGKQTTNLASINMTKLRRLPVPVPPRAEQVRIRLALEESLSTIDAAETSIAGGLARCAQLRQSVLRWAFEGRLVDQDPTDEPASALLERIRAERASVNGKAKVSGRSRARKAVR